MALIFNPEDKIQWEEWAPSLQDRLKAIFAKIYSGSLFIFKYLGNIRITIGERQPVNPVVYREIWWDTRFEVFRVLTSEGWVMTRATWYDGSNDNIQNDATSPISLNPRTNCHCYTISWNNSYYCHCKTQSSKAPSVPVNISNNEKASSFVPNPVSAPHISNPQYLYQLKNCLFQTA